MFYADSMQIQLFNSLPLSLPTTAQCHLYFYFYLQSMKVFVCVAGFSQGLRSLPDRIWNPKLIFKHVGNRKPWRIYSEGPKQEWLTLSSLAIS